MLLLRKRTGSLDPATLPAQLMQASDVEPDQVVRCKHCNHEITKASLSTEPYEGTYRNPLGYSFHVVFFSDATGARDFGSPTSADTWFSGFDWSMAVCRQCQQHLGWWWAGSTRFVGLIATRILQ